MLSARQAQANKRFEGGVIQNHCFRERRIMPQPDSRYVFVYGTLRRGERNDINLLQPAPRYVGMGAVNGTLYQVDWYPGLVLDGRADVQVVGEVYEIAPTLEAVLDRVEEVTAEADSEYFKRELSIDVGGHALPCLVYEINPERVRGKRVIEGGDWIGFHLK